jgi:putative ABC transport system ATP-binding protein
MTPPPEPPPAAGPPPSARPPIVEGRGLARRYRPFGREAMDAVVEASIVVPRGAFVAVTGPSGGGKTTLLSLLGLLERPTGGALLFDGRDVRDASEAERSRLRRRIGFAFQGSPMIRGLSLVENVAYPLVPRGGRASERLARAEEALARVGLAALARKRPEELSGGELQRVGLARALVGDPELVIADEPTSNLDAATAQLVLALLRDAHARGAAVLVASHDPTVLAQVTERYGMTAGRLRAVASA